MAQYGNFQNFTWDALEAAKNSRLSLIKMTQWDERPQEGKNILINNLFGKKIIEILSDNINTPKLLAEIYNQLNVHGSAVYPFLRQLEEKILKLGLFEKEETVEIPVEITALADQRIQAKKDKNYTLADELRNQIINQ